MDGNCGVGSLLELDRCSDIPEPNFSFEDMGGGSVKIHMFQGTSEYCVTSAWDLRLADCADTSNTFTPGRGDFWNGDKFEIIKKNSSPEECFGQGHHPKSGEQVRRLSCEGQRFDATSFYVKY